jgi:hypothetical protein
MVIKRGEGISGTSGNRYCERVGLESVPRVEDVLDKKRATVNLFRLMVVALLERGGPMSVEEIAARLTKAGAIAPSGDMVLSLTKAWHGHEPVRRNPDGRLGLNLSSSELGMIVWRAGLRPERYQSPAPPPEPAQPGDDVPLTGEEFSAAFQSRSLYGFSVHRQAAAVLDVQNQPMTVEEIEAVLAGMTEHRSRLGADRVHHWRSTMVKVDGEGRLTLDRSAPDVAVMRRAVRKLARPVLLQNARSEHWAKISAARKVELAEEQRQQAQEAVQLRRAVVRAVPEGEAPRAVSVLDVSARSIRTLAGGETSSVADVLAEFDVLVGLHIRDTLHSLDLDPDRWRLVDLKPPQKSRRLNRSGRTLQITPELLVASTTGISRPLGDPAKVAQYLAGGETGKLSRRLESDVKALFAFYQYGVLHHSVRLRWGFLDEMFPVDWSLPGEEHVYGLLQRAQETGTPVDIVAGTAPGWAEPWSRARRGRVLEVGPYEVSVRLESEVWHLERREIQAVRVSAGEDAT